MQAAMWRTLVFLAALCAGFGSGGGASAQAPTVPVDLPELFGMLESERELGVTCAALLKGYGAPQDQLRGRLEYTAARAAFNATVEATAAALASDGAQPNIEGTFAEGVAQREQLCERMLSVIPDMEGTKSPLLAILSSGIFGDVSKILDSAREAYVVYAAQDEARRNAMMSLLEVKKWPAFDEISPQR